VDKLLPVLPRFGLEISCSAGESVGARLRNPAAEVGDGQIGLVLNSRWIRRSHQLSRDWWSVLGLIPVMRTLPVRRQTRSGGLANVRAKGWFGRTLILPRPVLLPDVQDRPASFCPPEAFLNIAARLALP
jgi:hypothetical protein